ncbi:hypothetical protein KBB27_00890 [Patescibacteria group bacterium]|nr:hypothetical protein [Patescibacteria group bacterium]
MTRKALLLGVGCLVLLGAGCAGSSTPAVVDGGVYRTVDLAAHWTQPAVLVQSGKLGSIANVSVASAAFDPQDPATMYVGTTQNGLLMTLDSGASWQQARGLETGEVGGVAVDPQDKCTVFVARANQIMKTENCGRDWGQAYFDPRVAQVFTTVAISPQNTHVVYAGDADGDLIRTDDAGLSWRVLTRVEARINKITIDPRNANIIYAATNGAGVLKTTDGGTTWRAINASTDTFQARNPSMVVIDSANSNVLYLVSRNGLLRSEDAGGSWRALALPTPPASTNIRAFAVHPKNPKVLVYSTDTSVVLTADLGVTWTPKKLPTTRSTSFLTFDEGPQNALFLGTIVRAAQ